jgi:hypothetical protein
MYISTTYLNLHLNPMHCYVVVLFSLIYYFFSFSLFIIMSGRCKIAGRYSFGGAKNTAIAGTC